MLAALVMSLWRVCLSSIPFQKKEITTQRSFGSFAADDGSDWRRLSNYRARQKALPLPIDALYADIVTRIKAKHWKRRWSISPPHCLYLLVYIDLPNNAEHLEALAQQEKRGLWFNLVDSDCAWSRLSAPWNRPTSVGGSTRACRANAWSVLSFLSWKLPLVINEQRYLKPSLSCILSWCLCAV